VSAARHFITRSVVGSGAHGRVADREDQTDSRGQPGVYGAPRIHAELRTEHDVGVGGKRVARLMKVAGTSGVKPRKRWRTTMRIPGITPSTDLVERQFKPHRLNVLWVADITYLRTGEGCLYLAAVQDADSRAVVGWSMATHIRSTLVVDALKMALARRRPEPGLIHHSDQGSQTTFNRSSQRLDERSRDGNTASHRRSSRRSRRSSSTAPADHRGSSCSPPCSSTSRRPTTASAGTPRSACALLLPTNNYDSRRSMVENNRSNPGVNRSSQQLLFSVVQK
jgi:hypothetical protein